MKQLRIDYRDGQYYTRPVEESEVPEILRWGTVIELTPEQEARYNAHLEESAYWQERFREAENKSYEIRHHAGFSPEELP